jgi:hypothetical protein
MASIGTDRGAGQGRAQRAGFAGRRSLNSAAIGDFGERGHAIEELDFRYLIIQR